MRKYKPLILVSPEYLKLKDEIQLLREKYQQVVEDINRKELELCVMRTDWENK